MLIAHYKSAHKNDLIDDVNRTLLGLRFSRGVAAASDSTAASDAGPYHILTSPVIRLATTQALAFGPDIATQPATTKWGLDLDGHQFWRIFRQYMDANIKANSSAIV
jgi:hypothetical protein